MSTTVDYETDLHAWTKAQADALRRRAGNEIDYENIAEELEDLGSSHQSEIESRLENLLLHLLKCKYQPSMQSGSWLSSIIEARFRIVRVKERNPSLKRYPGDCLADIYPTAKARAIAETGLVAGDIPDACPWRIEDVLDDDFLP